MVLLLVFMQLTRDLLAIANFLLIFINDLIECCAAHSEIYLFADDAKLFQNILNDSDRQSLQEGINDLHEWTQRWLLKLNISKCGYSYVRRIWPICKCAAHLTNWSNARHLTKCATFGKLRSAFGQSYRQWPNANAICQMRAYLANCAAHLAKYFQNKTTYARPLFI